MKWLFLILLCSRLGWSEVKIVNGTGQELVLDLLSKRGSMTGVKLAAQPSPNFTIGPKSPGLESEMLVVRTPDGEEKYRTSVESGRIYILHLWNPYLTTYIGEYKAKSSGDNYPRVINATRIPLTVDLSYSDFTTSNGWTLNGPDTNTQVTESKLGSSRNNGEVVDAKLTPSDGGPALTAKLKCGVVYYLERNADGTLKLTQVGSY